MFSILECNQKSLNYNYSYNPVNPKNLDSDNFLWSMVYQLLSNQHRSAPTICYYFLLQI